MMMLMVIDEEQIRAFLTVIVVQYPTPVSGWVRSLPLLEVLIDALRPAPDEKCHPLRVISELTPNDISRAVSGCAEGLERVLRVRTAPRPFVSRHCLWCHSNYTNNKNNNKNKTKKNTTPGGGGRPERGLRRLRCQQDQVAKT